MNLQELRIGNKLKVSNNYWTVSDILTNQNELYFKENNLTDYYLFAEPIELTEEILLKCGFNKVREYFTIYNEFDVFKDNKGYYTHINCGNIYLNSLHQLQNLYFALTGEELEIQL